MGLLRWISTTFCALSGILCVVPAPAAGAASLTTIYNFPPHVLPMTGLVAGPGGAFYGATTATIYELTQDVHGAWHQATIYNAGAAVLIGSPTALYAATNTNNTVFELMPPVKGSTHWTGEILHVFRGGKDGSQPLGLALAPDGSLYGTTQLGGGSALCGSENGVPTGCGTLFRLAESKGKWSETVIHAFQGGKDGAIPVASPTFDAAGNLYFTTSEGAASSATASDPASNASPALKRPDDASGGCGGLFQYYIFSGNLTIEELQVLCVVNILNRMRYYQSEPYDFFNLVEPDRSAPRNPSATAIADELLFTAAGGGNQSKFCLDTSYGGCGAVAMLTRPSSGKPPWSLTVLHQFSGPDGFNPMGFLTGDGVSRVYGVAGSAVGSCPNQGCGEIFTLAKGSGGWAWGVVYRFTTDVFPVPQLTLYKGKLLGTTTGYLTHGTIYELTP
jgi:hypothetical protein